MPTIFSDNFTNEVFWIRSFRKQNMKPEPRYQKIYLEGITRKVEMAHNVFINKHALLQMKLWNRFSLDFVACLKQNWVCHCVENYKV